MRMLRIVCVALCCSCAAAHDKHVSPSQLNCDAESYDGHVVEVTGWLVLEDTEISFWDSKVDREAGRDPLNQCVSLLVPDEIFEGLRQFNRTKVRLVGVFHADIREVFSEVFLHLCNLKAIELRSVDDVQLAR